MVAYPSTRMFEGTVREEGLATRFGFRCGERGTHGSRSIMLAELRQLLAATHIGAAYEDYRVAIMEENVLGKGTASTRLWSWKKLRELYGLDPSLAVFRCFRELWETDAAGRPLLAILPLILYVYKNVSSSEKRSDMLRLLESYLVRRNVCRLTTKNYNVLFIQFIQKLETIRRESGTIDIESLAKIIRECDDTNRMPTGEEFGNAFLQKALSNQNAREILFLIALRQLSGGLADLPKMSLENYSVEHMMPMKWEANWMDRGMTPQEKADRNSKLGTLGNLTLVTKRLNSKMQNAAWSEKKKHLKNYSRLPLTVPYLDKEKWDEVTIDERAQELAKVAEAIWGGMRSGM